MNLFFSIILEDAIYITTVHANKVKNKIIIEKVESIMVIKIGKIKWKILSPIKIKRLSRILLFLLQKSVLLSVIEK